jgi:thymidylate kinase
MREVGGAIIILEGLDGTGKSTLASRLYKSLSTPLAILHAGPPVATTLIREYVWPLGIASNGYVVICDRWHLGERVWPEIFDRESLMPDVGTLHHVEENLRYLSCPILPLYMNRPLDDIRHELEVRQETTEHLAQANWLYAAAMADSKFDWVNTDLLHGENVVRRWLDELA